MNTYLVMYLEMISSLNIDEWKVIFFRSMHLNSSNGKFPKDKNINKLVGKSSSIHKTFITKKDYLSLVKI